MANLDAALTWLAWVSLIPLFYSIRNRDPAHASVCGGLWGVLVCLLGVAGGLLPWSVVTPVLLGGVVAAYAFLASHLTRRFGFNPVLLGLCWVLVECGRQPLGIAGGLVAYEAGGSIGNWIARVLGFALAAALVVFVNASLAAICAMVRWPPTLCGPVLCDAGRRHLDVALRLLHPTCAPSKDCRPRATPTLSARTSRTISFSRPGAFVQRVIGQMVDALTRSKTPGEKRGSVMKRITFLLVALSVTAFASTSAHAASWSFHFSYYDCPGGQLQVWGTVDCVRTQLIVETYANNCQTLTGDVPGEPINDIIFDFYWDYWCGNEDHIKFALPGWNGDTSQWELGELPPLDQCQRGGGHRLPGPR